MKTIQSVGIVSVGAFAPPSLLTNFDLEKMVDTSDEWIRTRSGISTRHIAGPELATTDIGYAGALQALERAQLAPEEVELIVMATMTPDYPLPSSACILQHRLGASNAAAYDIAAACTGFIYALGTASSQIACGQFRNALVLGVDTLSKVVDYTDRGTCVLLGDGGGAVVLQPVPEGHGILSMYQRADGSGEEMLKIPAGGSRLPASAETVAGGQHYLRMAGSEVYKFAVRVIEEAIVESLDRAGLTTADVALVIPHQANIRIIDSAAKRLNIKPERWVSNIADYGNTSAGSIPLAMNEAFEQGRLHTGDVVVLVGFGGGLTWGACVLRW